MRTKNLSVKFRIPVSINEPDGNGIMYSREAIIKACNESKNQPIEMYTKDGIMPIGFANEVMFVDESDEIEVNGVIYNGGTCEEVDFTNYLVSQMKITSFGFCVK